LVNNQTNQTFTANALGNQVELLHIMFGQYTLVIEHPNYATYRNNMFNVNQRYMAYAAILALQSVLLSEGFDAAFPPAGWVQWDQDGDGRIWERLTIFNLDPPINPHSGSHFIMSRTWQGDPGWEADNWMISPQIDMTGVEALNLTFVTAGESNYLDHIEVLVSTTGTNTGVPQGTLAPIGVPGTIIGDWTSVYRARSLSEAWGQHEVDLSDFTDAEYIYLALRHKDFDEHVVALDTVTLISGAAPNFGTIAGIVTNVNGGAPIAGARVRILDTDVETLTNEQGIYFLNAPAGTVRVYATATSMTPYTSGNINVTPGRQVAHNFTMGLPGTLTGIVTRLDGGPLANVLVELTGTTFSARTTPGGLYFINSIPAGNYQLVATLANYKDHTQTITIVSGQQLSYPFEMEPLDGFDQEIIPVVTALQGNFPNPFNPSTEIAFDLAETGHVSIEIFNIRGQRVTTLTNEEWKAGRHKIEWNGTDNYGRQVASGVYFYNMRTSEYNSTRRMILMK